MPKVKLTEKDLRKIVERLLVEEDPLASGAASTEDETNPRAVKITTENTPGLEEQISDLGTLQDQVSGQGNVYRLGYPSIDKMIARDGILAKYAEQTSILYSAGYDPNDINGSRINLVKTLLKYEIVLALQGKLPGQDAHRYAFFDDDTVYMRAQNDNWPKGDDAPSFVSLVRLRDAYYSKKEPKVVFFGTKEFYDLLDKSEFVRKLVEQEPWFSPETYASGVYISNTLQTEVASQARSQLAEIAEKIPKIYEQFDSDFVEEFFCVPLLMPNYWMSVKGPDNHPLYTPWRQTYVMLNILAQAMSIEGGIESLYLKFADFVTNGPRRSSGSLQPGSMDAYSTTVFKSLNESRKIMLTLRELRRILNASLLLKEAPRGVGGVADVGTAGRAAGAVGADVGTAAGRAGRFIYNTSADFITALDGNSKQVRVAIADSIEMATSVVATRLARLEAILGNSTRLAKTFDEACDGIGTHVDDELIPQRFWSTVGGGTAPAGGDAAAEIIRAFLKARAEALAAGSSAPALEAIEAVAKTIAEEGGDLRAAAELIKGVIDRHGDLAMVTPANLAIVKKAILSNNTAKTALDVAVNRVKGAIAAKLLDGLPPIQSTVGNTRFVTTVVFDETNNTIKWSASQLGSTTVFPTNSIDLANPGDKIEKLIQSISTADIDKEIKTDLLARLNEIRKATLGRFNDDTEIAGALIEQAATNNSQGVLRAAYAVASDADYTKFVTQQGQEVAKKGAFGTAVAMAEAGAATEKLERLGISVPSGLGTFLENSRALKFAGRALKTTQFIPELVGKGLFELTLYRFFSTTSYGKAIQWLRNKWWMPTMVGLWFLRKMSGSYVKSEAGTPGERATAEYPVVLSIMEIISECTRPGPYVNLLAAAMDNFYYGGSAGTQEFVAGQEVSSTNGLSAYGKVLGGAAGELMKALRRYDAAIDASPTLFPNLLQTAETGGAKEKVEDAAKALANYSRLAINFFSFSDSGTGEVDQLIRATQEANSAVQYAVDAERSSGDAAIGNQDWTNLEGTRQAATKFVIDSLQSRSSGSALKPVSVVNYQDVLIQMISRSDEREFVNKAGLWLASWVTGVEDPAYYDLNIETVQSGASGDDLMKLYAQNLRPPAAQGTTDAGGEPIAPLDPNDFTPAEMASFYEQTYGVKANQYKALRDALTALSGKVRPQIFMQAARPPSTPPEATPAEKKP